MRGPAVGCLLDQRPPTDAALYHETRLADQGFPVHLIEKEAELGGQLRKIRYTLERSDVAGFLTNLVRKVEVVRMHSAGQRQQARVPAAGWHTVYLRLGTLSRVTV